jgi:hypothetical protein
MGRFEVSGNDSWHSKTGIFPSNFELPILGLTEIFCFQIITDANEIITDQVITGNCF